MNNTASLFRLTLAGMLIFTGGCLFVSNSPVPRFYILQAADKEHAEHKFYIYPETLIAVGPVKIPDYLNRPQIVSINKHGMLSFAEFDRWGESLDSALARLINENLTLALPRVNVEMYPWNMNVAVRYQVIVDVIKLECEMDKGISFIAQWSVIDQKQKAMVSAKRFDSNLPIEPRSYAGLAKTLSGICAALSFDIAKEIFSLADQRQDTPAALEPK